MNSTHKGGQQKPRLGGVFACLAICLVKANRLLLDQQHVGTDSFQT